MLGWRVAALLAAIGAACGGGVAPLPGWRCAAGRAHDEGFSAQRPSPAPLRRGGAAARVAAGSAHPTPRRGRPPFRLAGWVLPTSEPQGVFPSAAEPPTGRVRRRLPPRLAWTRELDNAGNADLAWDVVELPTGEIVVVGITGPTPCQLGCNWDGWIVKLNRFGNVLWTRQTGGPGADLLTSAATLGTDVVVAGSTVVFPLGRQAWIFAVSQAGATIWERTFGGNGNDSANQVIATADGGLLVVGQATPAASPDGKSDLWLLRLGPAGEGEWARTYDLGSEDMGVAVAPLGADRFVVAEVTCTSGCGGLWQRGYASVLVIDAGGQVEAQKVWDEGPKTILHEAVATADGGAVLVGATSVHEEFPSADAWVVKLDADANVEWTRIFESPGRWDGAFAVVELPAGGYLVGGYSQVIQTADMNYDNFWLARLDGTGELLGSLTWGGPDNDDIYDLTLTRDGGVVLAGFADAVSWPLSAIPGPADFYVARLVELP